MKKFLSILLVGILAIGLMGCGDSKSGSTNSSKNESSDTKDEVDPTEISHTRTRLTEEVDKGGFVPTRMDYGIHTVDQELLDKYNLGYAETREVEYLPTEDKKDLYYNYLVPYDMSS